MTTYRKPTEHELWMANREKVTHQAWSAAKWYVGKAYPDGVTTLKVIVHSVYNDNTYDDEIESVEAYDAAGEHVLPDFSLPFWTEKNPNGWDSDDPSAQEEQAISECLYTPEDADDEEYDLTVEPSLATASRLRIIEEEPADALPA